MALQGAIPISFDSAFPAEAFIVSAADAMEQSLGSEATDRN